MLKHLSLGDDEGVDDKSLYLNRCIIHEAFIFIHSFIKETKLFHDVVKTWLLLANKIHQHNIEPSLLFNKFFDRDHHLVDVLKVVDDLLQTHAFELIRI